MTISRLAAQAADPSTSSATSQPQSIDGLADKATFLKLLVSQIKNQNPLNPSDGTAFVAQLATFSQVEQLVSIRQDLDQMKAESHGAATP